MPNHEDGRADRRRFVDADLLEISGFCQTIADATGFPLARDHLLRQVSKDLPASGFLLLRFLNEISPVTVSQLARIVGLHPSTVSLQLRPLTAQRLVVRRVDGLDRRMVHLSISAAGRRLCERVQTEGAGDWSVILGDWSARDRRQLAELMSRAGAEMRAVVRARLAAAELLPDDAVR